MTPGEKLYGVIASNALVYANKSGLTVAITSDRVMLSPVTPSWGRFTVVFLGPGSKADDKERDRANRLAGELASDHELEILKESVTRIDYLPLGFGSNGHVRFSTTGGVFQIETKARGLFGRANVFFELQLVTYVYYFAPDRLYREKTGELFEVRFKNWVKKQKHKQPEIEQWMIANGRATAQDFSY